MISASRRGDSIKGSPPVRMTSQIAGFARGCNRARPGRPCRESALSLPGPDHFAAETKAAIDRADMNKLEQHPVGIAVHDACDG